MGSIANALDHLAMKMEEFQKTGGDAAQEVQAKTKRLLGDAEASAGKPTKPKGSQVAPPEQGLTKLPDKVYNERERGLGWNKYQRQVVGRDFEERYRLPNGPEVGVDGDDGVNLICGKYWWVNETGRYTPTFPESERYESVVRGFVKQAAKLRTLRDLLGRDAVIYRFADVWAARHYENILRDAYPADFRLRTIKVEVVRPRF